MFSHEHSGVSWASDIGQMLVLFKHPGFVLHYCFVLKQPRLFPQRSYANNYFEIWTLRNCLRGIGFGDYVFHYALEGVVGDLLSNST